MNQEDVGKTKHTVDPEIFLSLQTISASVSN
jgi:hypothetical protein